MYTYYNRYTYIHLVEIPQIIKIMKYYGNKILFSFYIIIVQYDHDEILDKNVNIN